MSIIKKNISNDRLTEFFNDAYWYHTFDLGNGIVTKGTYDLRATVPLNKFPGSLEGKSVLDVGTCDGFYAFEFEKLGAKEILAVDTNRYDGSLPFDPSPSKIDSFINKHSRESKEFDKYNDIFSLLGLKGSNKLIVLADYWNSIVKFQHCSVYNLVDLDTKFDFVFCGALMEHLKNPLAAIEQLRSVTKEMCIISLSSALPISQFNNKSLRLRLANILLILFGLKDEVCLSHRDLVLKYVGGGGGGAFFNIHPSTFSEMVLASGFSRVEIVNEFGVINQRHSLPNHNVVFHCFV
ncbi:MAG: class I SAM-dependent methyltransferase [Pseudomonadota bacterium]